MAGYLDRVPAQRRELVFEVLDDYEPSGPLHLSRSEAEADARLLNSLPHHHATVIEREIAP